MNPAELSSRYQPDLNDTLVAMVGDSTLPLYSMIRYHLGWVDADGQARMSNGGKMLRPGLCLLACEAVGGDWRKALPAAAGIELLHNFTLIHDDIEDGDRERRGIPTVWYVWNMPQAINAGDAMHVLSRLAMLGLEKTGIEAGTTLRAARTVDQACLRLCEGQYLDISFEDRMDIEVDDYLRMIDGKTAALFECSLKVGALLGTENETTINNLANFGRNLGMAFQVRDDFLGIWGEDSRTGKSTASDILRKKKTLPVIYSLQKAGGDSRETLHSTYSLDEIKPGNIPAILQALENAGARQYANDIVRRYTGDALRELNEAELAPSAVQNFTSIAEFMVGREY
ncbi:MAG: polyprenyl synthetase family protein [Dehalococcoidia bacterium]